MLTSLLFRICASPSARAGAFGLAYIAGAEVGQALSLDSQEVGFATFWPPAGLLLAVLALTGYRQWPTIFLAACCANLASDVVLHDLPVSASLGFCLAKCGEAALGAWLLRRFVGTPFALDRLRGVFGLACLSALASTAFGAMAGAGVAHAAFDVSFWSAWQLWWVADASGVLAVAPVVLAWGARGAIPVKPFSAWRAAEAAAVFAALILVTEGVYGELLPRPLTVPIFILPFLLWAAVRFDARGASAAILVVALIGVGNVAQGRGPYTVLAGVPSYQVLRSQAALCVSSLCVLALAASVAERKQGELQRIKLIGELEQALAEIKTLRGLIPLCAWCKKIRDDEGFWQLLEDYLRRHTEVEFTHGLCPECLEKELTSFRRVQGALGGQPAR